MPPWWHLRPAGGSVALVFGALLCLVDATRASGQTVAYSNLSSSPSNAVQNYSGLQALGQSFTPSASGAITSLSLNLQTTNASTSVIFDVELWSNGSASQLPSVRLATLVNDRPWAPDNYISTIDSSHVATFSAESFAQNFSLVSGETYWLVVSSTSGSAKSWGISPVNSGPTAKYVQSTGLWSALPLSGDLGAAVSVSAIPEPSTYALVIGAVALVGAAARRRASRTRRSRHPHGEGV